jgi:diaminopimelate decarboxylase
MDHFLYRDEEAFCEEVSLRKIAESVDTPAYVYSSSTLLRHCSQFQEAFASHPTHLCYAVKANSNLSVLKILFSKGFGADIVSQGELERALIAGVKAEHIVYSGVGKKDAEIQRALEVGILAFNVESFFELEGIARIASKLSKKAPICLRLNPHIDAKTHPKISTGLHSTKFGISIDQLAGFLNFIRQNSQLELIGLACHIGSQLMDLVPLSQAAKEMVSLAKKVSNEGFALRYLNLGGGLGIRYTDEEAPSIPAYAEALLTHVKQTPFELILEPGRVLVGNAGVLLTRVLGLKETPQNKFLIVDAAMNDLLRPTLYEAKHAFCSVRRHEKTKLQIYNIVGPVCETGDFLGVDQELPPLKEGDLLYVRTCGAYGASMSSNYNSRPRAVEVLVEGSQFRVVRKREIFSDLWRGE